MKSPANAPGRLQLAAGYERRGQTDLAAAVLTAGLPLLDHNLDYVDATLTFFVRHRDDAEIGRLTTALLAPGSAPVGRDLIAIHAAAAAFRQGDLNQAEVLLRHYGLTTRSDGLLLQARIEWARGLTGLTLHRLTSRLEQTPQDLNVRAMLSDCYRELGQDTAWASSVVAMLASDPLSPAPRIAHLQLLNQRGEEQRVQHEAHDYLQLFARDPEALLLLGDFAAGTGRPDLARQVQTALASAPRLAVPATLLVAEAHLATREYPKAMLLLDRLMRAHPQAEPRTIQTVRGLQAVALYGQGHADEARLHLQVFLNGTELETDLLLAFADRLTAAGARRPARRLVEQAVTRDPSNPTALARLIETALQPDGSATFVGMLDRYLR